MTNKVQVEDFLVVSKEEDVTGLDVACRRCFIKTADELTVLIVINTTVALA